MKKSNWLGIAFSAVVVVCFLAWVPINAEKGHTPATIENTAASQISLGAQNSDTWTPKPLYFVGYVRDRIFGFNEAGIDDFSGKPSQPLAPITETLSFEIETGRVVIPAKTVKEFLQLDVHLRQRYNYRNDGQNGFQVMSNPIIEIESVALPNIVRYAVYGNGLHLGEAKTLIAGERGNISQGNFGRDFITARDLDGIYGAGTAKKFFQNDITISMHVANTVKGISNLTVATWTTIYGY